MSHSIRNPQLRAALEKRYAELIDRPLLSDEADELQDIAARLGKEIVWQHNNLQTGMTWRNGRHPDSNGDNK